MTRLMRISPPQQPSHIHTAGARHRSRWAINEELALRTKYGDAGGTMVWETIVVHETIIGSVIVFYCIVLVS